jgi:hypothetical protein
VKVMALLHAEQVDYVKAYYQCDCDDAKQILIADDKVYDALSRKNQFLQPVIDCCTVFPLRVHESSVVVVVLVLLVLMVLFLVLRHPTCKWNDVAKKGTTRVGPIIHTQTTGPSLTQQQQKTFPQGNTQTRCIYCRQKLSNYSVRKSRKKPLLPGRLTMLWMVLSLVHLPSVVYGFGNVLVVSRGYTCRSKGTTLPPHAVSSSVGMEGSNNTELALLDLLSPSPDCTVGRMSSTELAYIGDVVYELMVRSKKVWPPKRTQDLQNQVVRLVRGRCCI